ncbi:hypothetical protein H4R19_005864 [Coemansia spiralis]|nr:hypothetical protein H4R19_005864 [Coemansia spiralis]
MGAMRPFERVIDGAELASHIEALALGPADEESDAPAIACCGEQGYSRAQCYAELVCLQSAIVNLTLTPDDEYSVETGHRLLAEKQDAATKAFAVLGRNAVVTRLRGMVSATGLGSRLGDTAGGPLQAVVAHETTGTTRIRTRPARPRQQTPLDGPDDGPDGGPDDNAMDVDSDVAASRNDHGEAASGPDTGVADVAEERRVPGRGFSVSDKFLGAITTSLPAGFLAVDCAAVHARTRLSGRLGAAEFGYLCSLLGQGRLWLRPAYDLEHVGGLRGLAGFRRQERVAAVEFDVCAIAAAGLADAEIADSEELPGPEDESADAVGLDPEPLAVALRLVAGVVHALGPLGASAHELTRLFALFGSSGYREALAQVPQSVVEALAAEARIAALLRVLAQRESVFVVGSSDVRYVSAATYHQHWVLTAGDAELAPRLGQNLSGTANKTFAWSLLTALLGRIVNNPGISLATLARRYFAPYIPQFELLNCLRVLVALEIVDAETVPVPSDPRYPLHTTYYAPAPGYHRRLDRIARCSAVAEIQPVIPTDADLIGHLSTNA